MNLRLKRAPGIFLVGFMASGKTTAGRLLAGRLGWQFVDLDDDIEAGCGMAIADIFDLHGEAEFRRVETEALARRVRTIRAGQATVVALGGGAFTVAANRALVAESGISVWLDVPFELAAARVARETHRPLARDPEQFAALYAARRSAYAHADYRVEVTSDDAGTTVQAILELPFLAGEG